MTSLVELRCPAEKVSEIVNRTRVIADRLRLAVIHQDNLTKDCFDTKTIESIKNSYVKLCEELQGIKDEIQSGEGRLNEILEEYKALVEENASLKEIEKGFLNQENLTDEHAKIAKQLREMLQVYKLLTGVRFDFSDSENALTGYIGISGSKPSNSTLIPFEINKDNCDTKKLLWEKINEACLEVSE